MKYNIIVMWKELEAFRRQLRIAEEVGFDQIGIGDSPTTFRELYVSLAVAAMETRKVGLTSLIQVPAGRHPVIVASSISSLQELSGGRVSLTFGSGASGTEAMGRGPVKLSEMREFIAVLRRLLAGQRAEWEGRVAVPPNDPRPIPIQISSSGQRARQLAGAVADGVIISSGPLNPLLPGFIEDVRAGARAEGRDPAEVQIWLMTRVGLSNDRAEALEDAKGSLAAAGAYNFSAPAQLASVPEHLHEPLKRLRAGYDLTAHATAGSPNGRLIDDLGLTDFLAERFTMLGAVADCREQVARLAAMGIAGVSVSNTLDSEEGMRRFADVMA